MLYDFVSPSMRREWIEMRCGESGKILRRSPSMRREWIEMYPQHPVYPDVVCVSLHAEGVD